jgi:hypothetical protein
MKLPPISDEHIRELATACAVAEVKRLFDAFPEVRACNKTPPGATRRSASG